MLIQTKDLFPFSVKLLLPHIWSYGYGSIVYDLFKYPRKCLYINYTSQLKIKYVSLTLVDPDLTILIFFKKKFFYKDKIKQIMFSYNG